MADSFDKIVGWVQAVATRDFWVDGRLHRAPRSFRIHQSFFRDYVCHPHCGGCCKPYSLVWFRELTENYAALLHHYPDYAARLSERVVDVNGRPITVVVDDAFEEHAQRPDADSVYVNPRRAEPGLKCRHLNLSNGLCGIWGSAEQRASPFHCRFELIKLRVESGVGTLSKLLFSRGWNMSPPARCTMSPITEAQFDGDIAMLGELRIICETLGVKHRVGLILESLRRQRPRIKFAPPRGHADPDLVQIGATN